MPKPHSVDPATFAAVDPRTNYKRLYYCANRERILRRSREYYAKHLEQCREKRREYHRLHSAEISESRLARLESDPSIRHRARLKRHGITHDDYLRIMDVQDGACAICHKKPTGNQKLAIDHNHRDGIVRGLLCNACNVLLGFAFENQEILASAIVYLQRTSNQTKETA